MAGHNSFILYDDSFNLIEELDDRQAGILIKAIFMYRKGIELPDMDFATRLVFKSIKSYIDANYKKYEEICQKRRDNGRKGGEANASKRKQMIANASKSKQNIADNDTDNDTDNVSDNDTDKKKRKIFKPPTPEEIISYCKEANITIDAEQFCDYYIARDWILGNGRKMKDWKASVRTWHRNNKKWNPNNENMRGDNNDPEQRKGYNDLDDVFDM